jgi:hypothetical protein
VNNNRKEEEREKANKAGFIEDRNCPRTRFMGENTSVGVGRINSGGIRTNRWTDEAKIKKRLKVIIIILY